MQSLSELTQILYELAMNIGNSNDLDTMLKQSLRTMLRRLSGFGAVVLAKRTDGDRSWFQEVHVLPKNLKRNDDIACALDQLVAGDEAILPPTTWSNPNAVSCGERWIYRLDLSSYGTLLLLKSARLDPVVARSLRQVCDKLGAACVSCEVSQALVESKENLLRTTVSRDELLKSEERLRLLNQELERSNGELQQFAYVASHDLQEPLRMVASFTELIRERYDAKLDDKGRKFIAYAIDGAKRMQALVSDLLKLSRIGTAPTRLEPVDCNEVVATVVADLSKRIDESGAQISSDDLPIVMADQGQLAMVFQNLISNGIKFSKQDDPKVRVGVVERDDCWDFSVADNGIGIDPQYHERIFAIFQRLHQRGEYDGTGIGLAIVKKIVERHDGTITVESKQNEGATFKFTIPKG